MDIALKEAMIAQENGDVPVGAVITHGNKIIGRAHNQVELLKDPTAHAEMIAITQSASALGDWRLNDTVLYVTKEPCPMCAGAINLARIPKVIYGAKDPEGGGKLTVKEVISGVCGIKCRNVLQSFFITLRKKSNYS